VSRAPLISWKRKPARSVSADRRKLRSRSLVSRTVAFSGVKRRVIPTLRDRTDYMRPEPAVMATNTRSNRAMSLSMLCASNTPVSNSTRRPSSWPGMA
jgi:hypothetical protein